MARASSVIVPDPAKRNIERYTPKAKNIGGQAKKDIKKTLLMGAFQSCQSPKRREKASQIANTQMAESTKNAMIFFARRSRLASTERAAMIFVETLSTVCVCLRDIFKKRSTVAAIAFVF
jgi:hypothetical protein